MSPIIKYLYGFIAVSVSIFYGVRGLNIFNVGTQDWSKSEWCHQIWLNFVGSIAGWAVLFPIVVKLYRLIATDTAADFGIWDGIAFLIGFVGITGHLPVTILPLIEQVPKAIAAAAAYFAA